MISKATNSNGYTPTLTERKLLSVLANPEFYGKTVTDICLEAGVARDAYYRAFKKPEFTALCHELLRDMVRGIVGEVIKATYKYAISNAKNNADRRLLLEMAGIFTPRQIKQHTGPDGAPIQFCAGRVMDLTDEELEQLLALERDAEGNDNGEG